MFQILHAFDFEMWKILNAIINSLMTWIKEYTHCRLSVSESYKIGKSRKVIVTPHNCMVIITLSDIEMTDL